MELVFELIGELLLEGGIEIISNEKVSKWIRYPISIIIALLFIAVIFGILFLGVALLRENLLTALILIALGIIMLIASIIKFRHIYIEKHYDDSEF